MQDVSHDTPISAVDSAAPAAPFRLRVEAIRSVINFKRENDPAFESMSLSDIADKCRVGISTFKRILSGAATDCNCSTLSLICESLGVDPAEVLGLAPLRDYKREKETYDPTLMDTLRRQNAALEERLLHKKDVIDDLNARLNDLNKTLLDREGRLVNLRTIIHQEGHDGKIAIGQVREMEQRLADKRDQIADQAKTIAEQKAEIRKLRAMGIGLTLALIAVMAFAFYLVWEIANPTLGNFRY